MRKSFPNLLPSLIFVFLLFFTPSWNEVSAYSTDAETQSVILYVKPGANGTCSSWADACELQTALFNAVAGDQIWVAAGTYKPTTSSNRESTFQLKNGVSIYGGFPAGGGDWSQRDWETNATTLSGDIGIVGNNDDNSYHVVTGSGVDVTTIVDGFTISLGNANGTSPNDVGGGMHNYSSSPTLTNLIFSNNSAINEGGGMNNHFGSPTLTDVTFSGNTSEGSGGGMNNRDANNPTLMNVLFSGNEAVGDNDIKGGGGMANFRSNPNLTNVTFTNNTVVSGSGGGMYNKYSSPTLTNVIFSENVSINGGGLFNIFHCRSALTNVTFLGNTATVYGGGISNYGDSNPLLKSVSFTANEAGQTGGGVHNNESSPTMINVTISANTANAGGGMSNIYSSSPSLTNVTFSGNTASYRGGGIYNVSNFPGIPEVTNTIFWGNSPEQIDGDETTVTYSDIQGGFIGNGNIDVDPLLGELGDNGGSTQTHALSAGSPAIDAGNPNNCPASDQRFYVRPIDGNGDGTSICDMGAYEYGATVDGFILTVDTDGNGIVTKTPEKYGYSFGEIVTLTAIADNNWVFTGWSGDVSGTENPITVTIEGNTNITANFVVDEWSLNVSVTPEGMGSVTVDPLEENYQFGDEVTLTATAVPGWSFAGWSGDAEGIDTPLIVTIDSDINITANFTQDEYSLIVSVNPTGMGSVTISPLKPNYHYGDVVTLTPTAELGWTFDSWSGDASGTDNPLVYNITGNTSITANFTQDEYTLTVSINPTGKGSVNVDPLQATYHYGDVVTLIPTANPGLTFNGWGGDASGSDNPLTYTVVGNTSITATFTQDEYSLTVTPIGSGTVAINPVQATYHYGDVVTLIPTANPGWTFNGWGGDASGSDNPLTYTVVGNTSITATFTQDEYTLTITPIGSGTVAVDPVQATYHYGDVVTLTPTADPGWTFTGWSGNATGSDNPLTYTIVGNTSITATFTQDEYTLTVTPIGSGTVAVDPVQATYHYGDIVTLTPSADPGWTFIGWSGNATGSDNPLTYTIVGNTSITATFTQDEYTLTVTPIGSGTVAIDPVQATYHYGDIVTLTPTADPGWTFFGWGGQASGSENPLTYTIIGNTTISATFTQDEYTLTITPVGSGTVAVEPVQATYHYGDVITLTPTADPGWTFSEWGGDASGSNNPLTITIQGNTTITATFTQDEYSLTVTPIGSGIVTVDPIQATYHYGDIVTLTPTTDPGWTFTGWSDDGSGSDNPLTYTILGDTSITATFTQDEYTLTVTPIGSGTVVIDPVQATYHYGDLITLTPTANPGWTFDGWGGDGSGSDNPLTYTIVGDTSITATFTQNEYTLVVNVEPVGSGTVNISPMQTTYHYGDEVTLTPVTNPGWTFSEWTEDASGSNNPLTVTIFGDTNITANFTQDQYTLAVTIEGSGSVAIEPIQATYIYGTEVTLTATADPSWSFAGWSGDASGSDNPLTFAIQGDTSITALFTTNWIFLPMITR